MTTYTFILKPTKPFFFGGEKSSFDFADYLMHSRYFPQQTSALGLVREHILGVAGLLGKTRLEKSLCDKYIGDGSFNGKFDQGSIIGLSPVQVAAIDVKLNIVDTLYATRFDLNLNSELFKIKFNYGHENEKDKENLGFLKLNGKYYNSKEKSMIEFRFFKTKALNKEINFEADYVKDLQNNLDINKIDNNGVFIKTEKTGNTKNYMGQANDNAFYKQVSFDLNRGYAFAFEVNIDDEIFHTSLAVKNKIIRFGGRASSFSLNVIPEKKLMTLAENTGGNKILLLSDAYVDNEIYDQINASISETLTFRHAVTTNHEANFNKRLNKNYLKTKHDGSDRICLLQRGSVLFSNNTVETARLFNNKDFQSLGYNQIIIL